MKILAFGASNSSKSINKVLATYAASLIVSAQVETIDLNDFALPLYSEDKEKEIGKPDLAQVFFDKITNSDAVIISFAEHNGSYTAAYKNLFDWASRIDMRVYQDKPMVLLSTSPGSSGAASVLSFAIDSMRFFGGIVKGSLSFPNFYDNFDVNNNKVSNSQMYNRLQGEVSKLIEPSNSANLP